MGVKVDEVLLATNTSVSGEQPQAQGWSVDSEQVTHTEHSQKDLMVISSHGAENLQKDK